MSVEMESQDGIDVRQMRCMFHTALLGLFGQGLINLVL